MGRVDPAGSTKDPEPEVARIDTMMPSTPRAMLSKTIRFLAFQTHHRVRSNAVLVEGSSKLAVEVREEWMESMSVGAMAPEKSRSQRI